VVEEDHLLDECRKVAADIASCIPATVKVYKQLVDDGLGMTLAAGLVMERNLMAHANKGISGEAIASRRNTVQDRGKKQQAER
jgi:enoyl-CoA hydratase